MKQIWIYYKKNLTHGIFTKHSATKSLMFWKSIQLEFDSIQQCLNSTLKVLLTDIFILVTGSAVEGTHITSQDYGKYIDSINPCYISDRDLMFVWCYMQVIDEGETLPQRFDEYMYCRAERGEHTTDGFRKLRIIHDPASYSPRQCRVERWTQIIHTSVEYGYISSSNLMAAAQKMSLNSPTKQHLYIKSGKIFNNLCEISFYLIQRHNELAAIIWLCHVYMNWIH